MSKKLFLICIATSILSSGYIVGFQKLKSLTNNDVTIANIEALSRDEMANPGGQLDCSYEPVYVDCRIEITGDMAGKLIGCKLVEIIGTGEFKVYGNECKSGGQQTCAPLRCDRIYEILFGRN